MGAINHISKTTRHMTDNILQVIEQNGDLVVDSRLIAARLDIEHNSFTKTLKRYQVRIEGRFGVIRFEIDKPSEGGQGGRPEKYALLTEDQATTLMTFSKNTDAVVDCKMDLVEAFSQAKQIIKTVIPQQNDRIYELELRLALAQAESQTAIAQKNLLDTRKAITDMTNETVSALILGAQIVTDRTPVERVIDTQSGRSFEGVGITAIAQKLGYGKNTKACWQWLDSIGYGKDSGRWEEQIAAVFNHKLNSNAYDDILNKWNSGSRQKWIGEK